MGMSYQAPFYVIPKKSSKKRTRSCRQTHSFEKYDSVGRPRLNNKGLDFSLMNKILKGKNVKGKNVKGNFVKGRMLVLENGKKQERMRPKTAALFSSVK